MNIEQDILNSLNKIRITKRIIKFLIVICVIIAILFISYFIYTNFNKDYMFVLNGESNSFQYKNGLFIYSNNRYRLAHGNIIIKNSEIKQDNIVSYTLKCDNQLILHSDKVLEGIAAENKGYNEMFPKIVVNNIDKWQIEIKYTLNDNVITEIIELNKSNLNN